MSIPSKAFVSTWCLNGLRTNPLTWTFQKEPGSLPSLPHPFPPSPPSSKLQGVSPSPTAARGMGRRVAERGGAVSRDEGNGAGAVERRKSPFGGRVNAIDRPIPPGSSRTFVSFRWDWGGCSEGPNTWCFGTWRSGDSKDHTPAIGPNKGLEVTSDFWRAVLFLPKTKRTPPVTC